MENIHVCHHDFAIVTYTNQPKTPLCCPLCKALEIQRILNKNNIELSKSFEDISDELNERTEDFETLELEKNALTQQLKKATDEVEEWEQWSARNK